MGLIALLFSVVVDAIRPLRGRVRRWPSDHADLESDAAGPIEGGHSPHPPPTPHPLERPVARLIDHMSAEPAGPISSAQPTGRRLSAPGWIVVVGLPVLLVALAQSVLGAVAGLFEFVLHVVVLYMTVGLGAFHRQFLELQLLIGAGEASARNVLARWVRAAGSHEVVGVVGVGVDRDWAGASETAADAAGVSRLARPATAQAVLAAYRDVFAPLFWYAILPGATGPVLYLLARFAACHSHPFARTAYYWLDWIPLRVASLGLALAGQFEDAVFSLRSVNGLGAEVEASADPFIHQRQLLLPVAGGALGLRLTDAGLEARLRTLAPELDLPAADPEPSSLRPVAGLLLRSSVLWVGLYLLVNLLG